MRGYGGEERGSVEVLRALKWSGASGTTKLIEALTHLPSVRLTFVYMLPRLTHTVST